MPGRIVRTFPELLDAIRRDDYEAERWPTSPPAISPTTTAARPTGSSTSSSSAVADERAHPDHPDRPRPRRRSRSRGLLPLQRRVVFATAHADEHRRQPRDPARRARRAPSRDVRIDRPRPPAGARRPRQGRRGVARGRRRVLPRHLAGVHRRRLLLPDLRRPPRAGTTIIQTWHACGAFKKIGYSVLDKSFGMDDELARRVRVHSNYDVCLIGSQAAAVHYAEAFRQPLERFRSDLGIPRTDVLFGEERLARIARGRPRPLRPPRRPPGHPLRADVPRRHRHRRARDRRPRPRRPQGGRSAPTTSCSSGSIRSSARRRSSPRTSRTSPSTSRTTPTSTS